MELLTQWEVINVKVPAHLNLSGSDLHRGVMTGKPGECRGDLLERARELGLAGLFSDEELEFEVVVYGEPTTISHDRTCIE